MLGARGFAPVENKGVTAGSANACTSACTNSQDSGHDDPIEGLAAALRNLSPADRQRLDAMLADGTPANDSPDAADANKREGA